VILNRYRQIVYANKAFHRYVQSIGEPSPLGKRPGEALHCIHATESEGGCGTTEFCRTCGAVFSILKCQDDRENTSECLISRPPKLDSLELSVTATPMILNGERYTVFAVLDISHEKRRKALERIFFHDVLNTVGNINGFIELMAHATAEEKQDYQILLGMLTRKLIDEIQSQRDLEAAENNEMQIMPSPLQIISFLEDQCTFYRRHLVADGKSIDIATQSESSTIYTDPTILGRVVGNMIKNALEASGPGGSVTVGCQLQDQHIKIWVHNSTAMPRLVQLQVFQRSFSTKGKNRGLGTYSIKLLTERYLNGAVSFSSSAEEGTTFRIVLPLILSGEKAA
jgi:signal transduction histidine kinase